MIKRKRIIYTVLALIISLLVFATWYKMHFSMGVAEIYEVNPQIQETRILIATQESKFKNAIVKEIVEYYGSQPYYIKVIDVTNLGDVDASEWNAILFLHSWEMLKAQPDVAAFLNNTNNKDKIVVLTTSGDGGMSLAEVDGISGASVLEEVPSKVNELKSRLNAILQ